MLGAMSDSATVDAFIEAASVPIGTAHASGSLAEAERIRLASPDVVRASIHAAAVAGDDVAVAEWVRTDRALAIAVGGPRRWPPLVYLCFSRYVRLDATRGDGFVRAARVLLEAGADANGGFFDSSYSHRPEWECVLYGAAGIAHHEGLTRLLLAHGADPNDGEVTYHAGESYDLGPVRALLETGRLTADSLAVLLVRKHDWHDLEGVRLLLAHGADPNRMTGWGVTPLHQAVRRDNATAIVEALLAHGADPSLPLGPPLAPVAAGAPADALGLGAWRGRADLLALFETAGTGVTDNGPQALVAACARGDVPAARRLATELPAQRDYLDAHAGEVLSVFAGNGNADGVRCLLALGLPVDAVWPRGDGYFEIAPGSTALHVAAWRAQHAVVPALLESGASVNVVDARGRTPLALAVRACVASHWRARRRPDSIAALLAAGADPSVIALPTGYDDADALIAPRRSSD
jgi:hypothetical protein